MAKTVLKPRKYYDCYDVINAFGLKELSCLFDSDEVSCNGCLVTLFEPNPEMDINPESKRRYLNQKRIYDQLGEVEIHVWW